MSQTTQAAGWSELQAKLLPREVPVLHDPVFGNVSTFEDMQAGRCMA